MMVLPGGVGYDALEGLSNPKLSPAYAVFAEQTTMAGPKFRVTNHLSNSVIPTLVHWYKDLRALAGARKPTLFKAEEALFAPFSV